MKDISKLPGPTGHRNPAGGGERLSPAVLIATQSGSFQQVLGRITASASLPREFKGTHMSRFIEILAEWSQKPISGREIKLVLKEICSRLAAPAAEIALAFRYFLPVTAPVSKIPSPLDYSCEFHGRLTIPATGL